MHQEKVFPHVKLEKLFLVKKMQIICQAKLCSEIQILIENLKEPLSS